MSDLFDIEITKVEGSVARARLEVVHPDQSDVPCTKNLAFQVIAEAYWVTREGYFLDDAHARRVASGIILSHHPRRADLERFHALVFEQEFAKVRAEAEKVIVDVRLEDPLNHPRPRSPVSQPDPSATLVFSVVDADFVWHLRPGLRWSSAMFDFEGW